MLPQASHGLMLVQSFQGRAFRHAISDEFLAALTDRIPARAGVKPR